MLMSIDDAAANKIWSMIASNNTFYKSANAFKKKSCIPDTSENLLRKQNLFK